MDIPQSGKDVKASGEDYRILTALMKGSHQAYDKIFLKYYDRAIAFVRSFVHTKEDAEDIVEDVFVSLWLHRENLKPTRNFNAYLYTMMRNAVFNHFRSQKVRDKYQDSLSVRVDCVSGPTDEEFIAKETELLIKLTVDRMPSQRRKVYELRHQEGLDNREIARQLGISVKAVEKQLRLALDDIRKVIVAFLTFFYLS